MVPPMASPPSPPIVVNADPKADQLIVALRQLITVLGASAGVLGAHHASLLLGQAAIVLGPAAAVVAIIMGQLHTRHQGQKLATMASALPDEVAVTK
jgi:hypothetical protein